MNYLNHAPFFIFLNSKASILGCGQVCIQVRVYSKLMREASIRWKGRQILQLFFVTKVRVTFLSLLKSYKSSCLQLFCSRTAYFSTSFLTDLSFQSLEKLQQQSSKHSIIKQFGGCGVGRGEGGVFGRTSWAGYITGYLGLALVFVWDNTLQ